MWGDTYQSLMDKLVKDALINLCSENLPSRGSKIDIDGLVCFSSGKGSGNQIVVKIHTVLEPVKKAWQDSFDKSDSPWQVQLQKRTPQNESPDDGPVDLTGSRDSRSILKYTSESISNLAKSGAKEIVGQTSHTSGLQQSTDHNGAIYKGPLPVPRIAEDVAWESSVLNTLTKLQPTNYKPLPHLKLRPPVKTETPFQVDGNEQSSREMQCKICSHRCYGGFASLQSHIHEVHSRFVCRFCYNTFSLRCNLKRHERLHIGVKPYVCKVCNKSFARSTDLKMHMSKHGISESEVIVPCNKCPRTFLSVQNLKEHLYKVHKETEITYVCTICDKLFLDKDEYMKHRDEHNGNFGDSQLSSNDTVDHSQDTSDFMEVAPENSDNDDVDSDPGDLLIDLPSDEGTGDSPVKNREEKKDSVTAAAKDFEFELVNEPMSIDLSKTAINASENDQSDLRNDSSKGTTSGSRKRKKINPTKHVELPTTNDEDDDDDTDIDNMYYNSPVSKQRQMQKAKDSFTSTAPISDEPQNLVVHTKSQVMPSSSLLNIAKPQNKPVDLKVAERLLNGQSAVPAQGYLQPSVTLANPTWDSNSYKNLKGALSGQSIISIPGHKTPEPLKKLSKSESYSPLTLPILITPDSQKYRQSQKPPIKSETSPEAVNDDPNKEYHCVEFGCNETYLGFSAYEDHCMLKHGRYPCRYCKQTFSGKNNRTRHSRCHVGAKVYTCPDCFKNFSRPDSMREHQFIHTLSYQEDKCRYCGAAFDKKNLLLAHLKQCYRHKMETGKSAKLIDETPAYLSNSTDATTNDDIEFKPLLPVQLEAIPMLTNVDGVNSTPPPPSTSSGVKSMSPSLFGISSNLFEPHKISNSAMKSNGKPETRPSPIVIMPTDSSFTPPARSSPVQMSSTPLNSALTKSIPFVPRPPLATVLTQPAQRASPVQNSGTFSSFTVPVVSNKPAVSSNSGLPISVPVVLTPNAVAEAVKAVSSSSASQVAIAVPTLLKSLTTTDSGSNPQSNHVPVSSSSLESPVNSVLDAVKNLVKSRASPTIVNTDQNANKTPGVESSE